MRISAAIFLFSLLFFGGCASYQWEEGSSLQRIYVAPVTNEAFAPHFSGLLTTEIRQELIRSGQYELVDEGQAELVLKTNVTGATRTRSALDPTDTGQSISRDYRIRTSIELFDRSGDLLKEQEISALNEVYLVFNGAEEERQSQPDLARQLAQQIRHELTRQ